MPDINYKNLVAAFPLNSEWGFVDASPYIRGDGYSGLKTISLDNTNISTSQFKYYGQSAYFNGIDDGLVSTDYTNLLVADFTLEAWVRFTGNNSENTDQHFLAIRDGSTNGISLMKNATGNVLSLYIGETGSVVSGTTSLQNNTWYHVAVTRSASTVRIFINGTQEYVGTPTSFSIGARKLSVGSRWDGNYGMVGFIQDVRVYNKAIYASSFNPPTQIVEYNSDSSGKNFIELFAPYNSNSRMGDVSSIIKGYGVNIGKTVMGNASISSAQSKFYGQSALFDGSGDGIKYSANSAFGKQNFTLEYWFRPNVTNVYQTLTDTRTNDNNVSGFFTGITSGGNFYTYGFPAGTGEGNYFAVSPNTWYHVAIVRNGSSGKVFINGIQRHEVSMGSTNYTQNNFNVGIAGFTDSVFLNGYVQDLFIYHGYAKYIANFTPSTSGFFNQPSIGRVSRKLIGSVKLGQPQSRVEFNSIPQNFDDLEIWQSARATSDSGGGGSVSVYANETHVGTYKNRTMYGAGFSGALGAAESTRGLRSGSSVNSGDAPGNSVDRAFIYNYSSSSSNKFVHSMASQPNFGASSYAYHLYTVGSWTGTDPINTVTLIRDGSGSDSTSGRFDAGSTFYLYAVSRDL